MFRPALLSLLTLIAGTLLAPPESLTTIGVALSMMKGEAYEQRTWISFQLVTPANMDRFGAR